MGGFNKGPMMANFACPFAWHYTMHAILRDPALVKELITFAHPTDAKCWLLWQLSDSLALTLTGAYCVYSIFMNHTPLEPMDAAKAFKTYRTYPPSSALRRLGQPMFDAACKKLKTAGPSPDMLTGPGTRATHTLLAPRDLGRMAEFFPTESPEPPQHTAHTCTRTTGRSRARRAMAPSRRPSPTRRITSSRRWHTTFTDHDLLQRDFHTALQSANPALPEPQPVYPQHPMPQKQSTRLIHVSELSTPRSQPVPAYTPVARPPKSQKYATRFGVPDAMVLIKHKYRETEPRAKVKARAVIRHGTHHYKSLARKMSRCVSVLWKYLTNHPTSVEVLAVHDVKHFVGNLRAAHDDTLTEPSAQPGLWGERDVEEIFPNIPKPLISEAKKHYWSLMCRSQGGQDHKFAFFLHKSGEKLLDHVASPSTRTDSYMYINDLHAFTQWDLAFNGRLVSFLGIHEQTTGCPMGGSCSAQYASLVLNYLERGVDWSTLPPICRYRDNYPVYLTPTWSPVPQSGLPDPPPYSERGAFLSCVKRIVERASSLKLTVEGWRASLPFLESQPCFTGALPDIGMKEPTFQCNRGDSPPPSDARLLDCWSPNTRSMLRFPTPNLFKKFAFYRFDRQGFVKTIHAVATLLSKKQYPNSLGVTSCPPSRTLLRETHRRKGVVPEADRRRLEGITTLPRVPTLLYRHAAGHRHEGTYLPMQPWGLPATV